MSDPIAAVLAAAEAVKAILDLKKRNEEKAAKDILDAENAVAGKTVPPQKEK